MFKPITQLSQQGQVLLEFVITLPLLLFLLTATINIARLLDEVDRIDDAIRNTGSVIVYENRKGIYYCADLERYGSDWLDIYLDSQKTNRNWWHRGDIRTFKQTWLGTEMTFFEIKLTSSDNPNCIFCFENILDKFRIERKAIYPLLNRCI